MLLYVVMIIMSYTLQEPNVAGWKTLCRFRVTEGKISCKQWMFQHAMFDYRREGTTIIMNNVANDNRHDDSKNYQKRVMTIMKMIMMVIIVNDHH